MFKALVVVLLFFSEAKAEPLQPIRPKTFRYSLRDEKVEYENLFKTHHRWYGVQYEGMSVALRDDRKNAQASVATSFYGLQLNFGFESMGTLYGLMGYEFPVVSPVTFFVASVHQPGGGQRFLGGPIYNHAYGTTQLFFFEDGPRLGSLSLRNRFRFESLYLDADLNYRFRHRAVFSPWGWAVELGCRYVYVRGGVATFWDGFEQKRETLEVGIFFRG